MEVFYEIVVLDMCSKPIFCSKVAQKGKTYSRLLEPQKIALNAKRCAKVAEDIRSRPNLEVMHCIFQSTGSKKKGILELCLSITHVLSGMSDLIIARYQCLLFDVAFYFQMHHTNTHTHTRCKVWLSHDLVPPDQSLKQWYFTAT